MPPKILSEITINFSQNLSDIVLGALSALGIDSFEEKQNLDLLSIILYLDASTNIEKLCEEIRSRVLQSGIEGKISFTQKVYENASWATEWKKYWKPISVGEKLWITIDEVNDAPPLGKIPITLQSTFAFGTGSHPTTKLALELIERAISKTSCSSFLDVGCGSGILAIAASKLGSQNVLGIDCDDEAVTASRANADRNEVDATFQVTPIAMISEKFDLIVANIISSVLLPMMGDFKRLLKPGGGLILSGILADEEKELLDQLPFKILERNESDGWVGFSVA